MDGMMVNTSSTSVDVMEQEELTTLFSFSNQYIQFIMEKYIWVLQFLGIVGNIMVFLVAKYMVNIEKKKGNYFDFVFM